MRTRTGIDASSMLDYVDNILLCGFGNEATGDVEYPLGWFGRVGKYVVHEDHYGFKDLLRFDSETEAQAFMNDIYDRYDELEF